MCEREVRFGLKSSHFTASHTELGCFRNLPKTFCISNTRVPYHCPVLVILIALQMNEFYTHTKDRLPPSFHTVKYSVRDF